MAAHSRSNGWEDPDFPAAQQSIYPADAKKKAATADDDDFDNNNDDDNDSGNAPKRGPPRCRCGVEAGKSNVKKDTPNKGRPYWHCAFFDCSPSSSFL